MSFLGSREQVAPEGIGKPVRRREDARLLTGAGHYADDMNLPGQAYAYPVRSPHAHARIASIDIGPAEDAPGVIAVLTGSDAAKDGLQPIPHRDETMSIPSYAYTCAACEVEVDPETGIVDVVRYTSIDDCGRAVNPMLIHGQSHGGIAQGIGQALWEECVYDPRSGQLLSGSLMDYAMPRADLLPAFQTEISEVPSTTNPLGMRGGSEGGITPGLAAVANAIVDALAEFGVEHIDMPATPERVWRAIRSACRG